MVKTNAWLVLLMILCPLAVLGQTPEAEPETATVQAEPETPAWTPTAPQPSPVYFGGTLILGFGDFTRIGVQPLIGYKATPKLSVGVKLAYEYISDKRYSTTYESHNYGASVFGRYFVVPRLYAHAEYAYFNYDYLTSPITSERQWVPFLLLGGGYRTPISARASLYIEVLFDVLQDSLSPYAEWEPQVSIGVAVGF